MAAPAAPAAGSVPAGEIERVVIHRKGSPDAPPVHFKPDMLNARPVDVVLRLLKTTVFQNLDAENMEFVLEKRHDGTSEELEDISLLCSTSGWKTGKQGVYYTAMDDQPEVAAPAEPAQRAATFGVRFSGRSSQGLADAVASSGAPEGFDPLGKVAPRAQVTTNAKAKAAAAAVTQKEKVMAAAGAAPLHDMLAILGKSSAPIHILSEEIFVNYFDPKGFEMARNITNRSANQPEWGNTLTVATAVITEIVDPSNPAKKMHVDPVSMQDWNLFVNKHLAKPTGQHIIFMGEPTAKIVRDFVNKKAELAARRSRGVADFQEPRYNVVFKLGTSGKDPTTITIEIEGMLDPHPYTQLADAFSAFMTKKLNAEEPLEVYKMFVPNKPPKGAGRRPNNFQDAVNEITPDNFPVSKLTEVMAYEANCNYIGVVLTSMYFERGSQHAILRTMTTPEKKYSLNRKDPERLVNPTSGGALLQSYVNGIAMCHAAMFHKMCPTDVLKLRDGMTRPLSLRIEDAHRELVNLELRPYVVPEDKLEDAMKDARNGKSAFLVHPCSVCGYKRIGNPEHDEIVEKFSRTSKHVFVCDWLGYKCYQGPCFGVCRQGSKDFCHCEEEDGPVEDVEHVEKTPAPPKRGRRSKTEKEAAAQALPAAPPLPDPKLGSSSSDPLPLDTPAASSSRPAAEGSRKRARTMNYAVLASGGLDLEAAKEKAQQEKGQQ
eukprot:tig00000912_g5419.t1